MLPIDVLERGDSKCGRRDCGRPGREILWFLVRPPRIDSDLGVPERCVQYLPGYPIFIMTHLVHSAAAFATDKAKGGGLREVREFAEHAGRRRKLKEWEYDRETIKNYLTPRPLSFSVRQNTETNVPRGSDKGHCRSHLPS
jgi:hypothetical protein